MSALRKEDIFDLDILDADELRSDGYSVFASNVEILSTDHNTKNIVVSNFYLLSPDEYVESGDRILLSNTITADGYYTVNEVINGTTFSVHEDIQSSSTGTCTFMYNAGALNVGLDPTKMLSVTAHNVQDAIEQLDKKIDEVSNNSGTLLTKTEHTVLRQLTHLADGVGGPFENFISGAYREFNGSFLAPSSISWYTNSLKQFKILEKTILYTTFLSPNVITWTVFDIDGITALSSVTDTIYYSGVFETHRVRTVNSIDNSTSNVNIENHKSLRQLIHLADGVGGGFENFPSGMYREVLQNQNNLPSSFVWYIDGSKTQKIVEKNIVYNSVVPTKITWKVYDIDGTTVLHTVEDNIEYVNNIFEVSRTRNII
jgi:hypothetical protein